MARFVVALALLASCTESKTKQCGVLTCGPDSVCSPNNDRCVTQTQLDACADEIDGAGCSVPGISSGVCTGGVCLGAGCGNGIEEETADEVCDDGNLISGDGCRADCKSREVCGDGVLDFNAPIRETCDCGTDMNNLPLGCTEINSDSRTASCHSDCSAARCGDGMIGIAEVCDDGNNLPGDGCRADCLGRWTPMQSQTLASLADVDAVSETNAWAVGLKKILRWDGVEWTSVPLPPSTDNHSFTRVLMLAPDDIVVIGVSQTSNYTVYRHFQGTWTPVTPGNASGSATFRALASNGTSTFVAGNESTTPYVAAWSGTQFFNQFSFGSNLSVRSFAVTPGGTRFVVADSTAVYKETQGAFNVISETGIELLAPANDSLWLFGNGASYHSTTGGDSGTWNLIPDSTELGSVNGADATATFAVAVGNSGHAVMCTPTRCKLTPTGTTTPLYGVAVIDDKHAFIVGASGTILY